MNNKVHSGSVILDPKKGANTRKVVCPRCGKDHGHVMLGTREFAGICNSCKVFNVGLPPGASKCEACGSDDINIERIPKDMPLPKMCEACEKEMDTQAAIIQAGGIMWQCEDCGHTGTIGPDHPLAQDVRAEAECPAPAPCGAKLDKTTCPVCQMGGIN